jgi:ADP-ribose pyrophosphatase YjhB (NUDIX family)
VGPAPDAPRLRVAAYAICIDDDDRLLLARCAEGEPEPGAWTLPGGGIEWGEHPDDAVLRELEEETGLLGELGGVLGIFSAVHLRSDRRPRDSLHAIGILYRMRSWRGDLRVEVDGTTDACEWFARLDLEHLPLVALASFGASLAWPA